MADLTFRFDDAFAFGAKMAAAPRIVQDEMTQGIDRLTIYGESTYKQYVRVRSGHLRRSIAHQAATFGGGVARGSYGTATPYAKWETDGRGPVVARGRALRFTIGGQTIYRKRVGPAKGSQSFQRSAAQVRARVPAEFARVADRIAARMGFA